MSGQQDQPKPLASPDDLAQRLNCKPDDPKLALCLRLASDRFTGQSRNPIIQSTDAVILDGTGGRTVRLPVRPVTDVDKVLFNGQPADPEWSADGMLRFAHPVDGWRSIQVTYTHGYDPVPGDVEDAVLEQAAAIYQVMPGLASWTTGEESRTYSVAQSVGTSAAWSAAIAKYRIGGIL
ncbi:hypothetical protein [Bifidobacterium sp. A11]|uniref:hypothetical protein n=1 Tax=Bifidobacterium sp. A11 TaxID=1394176 RepID=UPI0003F71981|nr:hypothetical protein [Bifidobacterium sp. A11]